MTRAFKFVRFAAVEEWGNEIKEAPKFPRKNIIGRELFDFDDSE